MVKGQCKEAEAQLRVAVEVHYSMDPATQDMQVGHTRGFVEAVVDAEDADMVDLDPENCKAVQAVVENHKEEFDYIRTLLVVGEAGMQDFGVERDWVYFQYRQAVGDWLLEPDEAAQRKDKHTHLNFYHLGN